MKRKVTVSVMVLLSAMLATGCENAIPELNDQEHDMVVEYAAGVVLKHDKYYGSRLVDLSLEEETAPEEETAESYVPEEEEKEPDSQGETDVTVTDNTQETENKIVSIESFLHLDSAKITYTGYETDDFYPNQGDELYFVMNATEGNRLLILKFSVESTSGADVDLDIAQSETRFKIVVNGEAKNALTTMLLNDLAHYQGTIASNEGTELVLICEVTKEQAEEISSLELIMKNADDSATISLN